MTELGFVGTLTLLSSIYLGNSQREGPTLTNKEINRVSGRIFEGLLPPNWAFRSQEDQEDYGIDGEIEITTSEDKATGFIFKVQLKGTEHASYDGDGQLLYSDASVERFSYYVQRVRVPVIFVVCDIREERCFWTRVQGQPQVEAALKSAADKGQQTFTIKLSRSRIFEKTDACASMVVEAVASATDTLTLRSLKKLSGDVVSKHLADDPDLISAEKKFRLFAGIASLEAISSLMRSGDLDSALRKGRALLESSMEEPAMRIQAGVLLAHAYAKNLHRTDAKNAAFDAARFRLGVADAMLRISRQPNCDPRMRLYVRAYARASRMQVNARIMLALAVSENVQSRQGLTLAGPLTAIERIRATSRVMRDFRRIQIILGEALNRKFYSLVPYLVDDWLEVALPFTYALRFAGQKEMAGACSEALWQGVPLSIEVAKVMIEERAAYAVIYSIGLRVVGIAANDDFEAGKFIARFEQELTKERPIAGSAEIVRTMRDLLKRAANEAEQKPTMAEVRAYYEQQAAALGIDLSDPDDRIAEVIRIGLEDLDPTRVASKCRHIHLRNGPHGIPAEMLGLPTAGSKSIICLKHGHSMQGLKLDDVYALFSRSMPWSRDQVRCENCPDVSPHPEGWNWSEEWAVEQDARHATLRGNKSKGKE